MRASFPLFFGAAKTISLSDPGRIYFDFILP